MKNLVINFVMTICILLLTALAVVLGIESVWVWIYRISPAWWWWCAPLGIVESIGLFALVGYASLRWMHGQMKK